MMSKKAPESYERKKEEEEEGDQVPIAKPPLVAIQESELSTNDVLCGRGGWVNSFPGNLQFREILKRNKEAYTKAKKKRKLAIVNKIIHTIRCMDPPGRFLAEDKEVDGWVDIGDAKAIKKCGQAIRQTKIEKIHLDEIKLQQPQTETRNTQQQTTNQTTIENNQQRQSLPERYQVQVARAQESVEDILSPDSAARRRRFHELVGEPSCLPPAPALTPPPPIKSGTENLTELSEELMKESLIIPSDSKHKKDEI